MMIGMNFSPKWRTWKIECVTSATTSVLINESSSIEFKLERGLRQCDPLSPFLYLVTEGLSILINPVLNTNLLEALELGREGEGEPPSIRGRLSREN